MIYEGIEPRHGCSVDSNVLYVLNAVDEQVFLTPKDCAAAFDDAVDMGEKIGIMKGKL